jgi:hypothetical protein
LNKTSSGAPIRPDDDSSADESRRIWQESPAEQVYLSQENFHARLIHVARANRRLRLLRSIQHIGTIGGILGSIVMAFAFADVLMKAGSIGLALAFVYRWWVLRRALPLSESAGPLTDTEPSLIAYRSALLRRIADDSGAQLWSRLAIGVPAAALFLWGFARSYPTLAPVIALEAVAIAIGLAFAFASAARRARHCRAELDALNALDRDDVAAR